MAESVELTLIDKTLEVLNRIPLNKLDDDTVQYFWDNAFADINEVADDVGKEIVTDGVELPEHLQSFYDVCISWIEESKKNVRPALESESTLNTDDSSVDISSLRQSLESCSDDSCSVSNVELPQRQFRPESSRCQLWEILIENDIPIKKIMTLMYVLLHYGNSKPVSNEKKELALLGIRVYLGLLRIPGSTAFRLFQVNIFTEVLNTLRIPMENKKKKPKPGKRKGDANRDRISSPEPDEAEGTWTVGDSVQLLRHVLNDFVLVLKTNSLKPYPLLVDTSVQLLAKLTHLETETISSFDDSLTPSRRYYFNGVAFSAFKTILALCDSNHGQVNVLCCTIMKHFMPSVLMSAAGSVQNVQKQYQTVKDNAIVFLKHMIRVVGESSLPAARIFLQQIATKSPDRAEFRTKIAQSAVSLLESFPNDKFASMIEWYFKLSKNNRVNFRVFALELFSLIIIDYRCLITKERISNEQYKDVVKAVVDRCKDRSPSVRSKALSIIAHYLAFVEQERRGSASAANSYPDLPLDVLHSHFIEMLRDRCCDEKVNVRKSGIQLLEQIMRLDQKFYTRENLDLLTELCRDVGLMARKQALQSLTSCLLSNPSSVDAQKYWVMGVLPSIADREVSIQEKCIEALDAVLIQNLTRTTTVLYEMALGILENIADGEQQGFQPCLRKAIQMCVCNGHMRPNVVVAVRQLVRGRYNSTAWFLLSEISACYPIGNSSFALAYWEENKSCSSTAILHRLLQTILHTIKGENKPEFRNLYSTLLHKLEAFSFPTGLIGISVDVVEKLDTVVSRRSNILDRWYTEILISVESLLSSTIRRQAEKLDAEKEEVFIRHLFTLGVLSKISAELMLNKNLYSLVQTIIACSSNGSFRQPLSELAPSQVPLSQIKLGFVTSRIRAYTFGTLGRMCLHNEDYANQNIVPLVKELHLSQEETIKNNILIIMADLCIRYPTLVDPYMSDITACLQDKSIFVRKQVLSLLTRLLQEDYIKCKGLLFYRLLVAYVDDFEEICELAEFALVQVLLTRNALVFYQHFVESIFFLNCYTDHSVYNKFSQTEDEANLFALVGPDNENKRLKIYKFMLENMDDENKFNLNLRICQEILAAVIDQVIPLSAKSTGLIQDSLRILCSEEIKLSSITGTQDDVEDDIVSDAIAQGKKTILSKVVKGNIVENIVPIVVALKHLFQSKNSVLLRDLMLFLRELLKDYKNELKEILTDKQLAKEIEFDMKRFAEQEEERRRKEQAKNARRRTASITAEHLRVPIKPEIVRNLPEQHCHETRPAGSNHSIDDSSRRSTTGRIPMTSLHDKRDSSALKDVGASFTPCASNPRTIQRTLLNVSSTLREVSVHLMPLTSDIEAIKRTLRDVVVKLTALDSCSTSNTSTQACGDSIVSLDNEASIATPERMDVDNNSVANSGPIPVANVDSKPENLAHSSASNRHAQGDSDTLCNFSVNLSPSPATIKRTLSCDEVVEKK